jgi:hypothetical protein
LKVPLVACFDKEYLYVGDQFQGLWRTRIADLHLAVEESTYSQTREFIVPNPCSGDFRIEASTSPRNIHLFDRTRAVATRESIRAWSRNYDTGCAGRV